MPQTAKAIHHFYQKKIFKNTIDKLAYPAGIASAIFTLPQLFKIWTSQNTSGVSLITWAAYLVIAIIMTFYGIIHKEKPLILMYGLLTLINFLITLGIIIY